MKTPLVFLLGFALLQVAGPSVAQGRDVDATWQKHELDFVYMGFTTHYSCEGLRDKLGVLLKASGARPDFTITMRGCPADPGQVTEFPRVGLVFYTAAMPSDAAKDAGSPVKAQWKSVAITPQHPRELELGDCELVEQFHDRLLPAFTTRNLKDDTNCIPHQLSGSNFSLQYDVLAGIQAPAKARPSH